MAQVGPPRALDEVKRREICALVAAGCGIQWASRYVGVSEAHPSPLLSVFAPLREPIRRPDKIPNVFP
jgi:hypothetical protein